MFAKAGHETELGRLLEDLRQEDPVRLAHIVNQLQTEERAQYWEFTPRGANFAYLDPELRPHLERILPQLKI